MAIIIIMDVRYRLISSMRRGHAKMACSSIDGEILNLTLKQVMIKTVSFSICARPCIICHYFF